MAKTRRKCESAETWRRRIETWEDSGLSVTAFAEQEGLCKSSFLRWRKKLGGEQWIRSRRSSGRSLDGLPSVLRDEVKDAQTLSFVELAPKAAPCAIGHGVPFEVGLRSGRRLQVPTTFDPETLRQLVAILEVQ